MQKITTVVNAKIEKKGWPGLNRVCQYCTLLNNSYLGISLKTTTTTKQNKAKTKKIKERKGERNREREKEKQ